jgi:protein-S-isoprenylcysteine O-methyltransferase Ste14
VVLRNVLGIPLWVLGLALAVGTPSAALFAPSALPVAVGWLLMLLGAGAQLLAIAAIRLRAAAPSRQDALVAAGIYARIRHPIYAGLLAQFAALVLVQPRRAVAVASLLGVAWALVQARLEEMDLLQRMPAYRDYLTRVPRYLPRLGRTSGTGRA